MVEFDEDHLVRTLAYEYARIKQAIEQDWTQKRPPIALLDKEYLRLTEETIEDGVLMNEQIMIENDGPVLNNDLDTVPSKYDQKMGLQQLLQSRLMRCE